MSNPTILEVLPGSLAATFGLCVGDELLSVNGAVPTDVIEYQQLVDDADVELGLRRGENMMRVAISKQPGEPLGLRLNKSIFDRVQTCDNHCEFCFIYQLPPGMRQSLYLKDDDYRLSFLYGNFTTLTRFTELDLSRVVEEKLGPLYVSIHATDPDVRASMLRNPRGATSLRWLRELLRRGVEVHGQIVLCPGINAGAVLDRTCAEIVARYSALATVGIVPLGVSKYSPSDNLRWHSPLEAAADLEIVGRWQEVALEKHGRRIFQASDEMYLHAGLPIPETATYGDFAQHENGIGMVRAFMNELEMLERHDIGESRVVTGEWHSLPAAPALGYRAPRVTKDRAAPVNEGPVILVTGRYGHLALAPLIERLEGLAGRPIRVLTVGNRFFGGNVGVAGLITGEDLAEALHQDGAASGVYVVPNVALQGDVFLDDRTLDSVASVTDLPVVTAEPTVAGLLAAIA